MVAAEAGGGASVTRLVLLLAGLGGIPRLISALKVGLPHPVFIGAMALEFVGMPAMLIWHRAVFPPRS